MNIHCHRLAGLLAALLAGMGPFSAVCAQGTSVVPATDLAYRDLDRLAELGLLDSMIVGQRPYSRRELARLAAMVRARAERDGVSDRGVMAMLDRLNERFGTSALSAPASEASRYGIDGGSLTFTGTDAVRRGFTPRYASGIEATIDPLATRRLGSPAVSGQSVAAELAQTPEPLQWLAFQTRERAELRFPRDARRSDAALELLLASVRMRYRNVALIVGRTQLAWAQGEGDGLFLASDAPALDQLSLSADRPFRLPGLLSRLGPAQATIVYADLGASAARSHSALIAYKVSVKPASSLELGGTFMNHFGGEGAPPTGLGNRVIDLLPFIDIFRKHAYDAAGAQDVESDKLLGVDGRWRIAGLGGLLLSGELLIDDFDVHRIPYLFTGYGSSNIAVTVPRLGSPEWSMRLSARHMGILTYTHSPLTNGITTRGRLLGDELGPDAKAFAAELRWRIAPRARTTLEVRSALYSDATYSSFYVDAERTRFVVRKTSRGPNELRDRLRVSVELYQRSASALVVRAGAERVRNAFVAGTQGRHYVADVALRVGL